MNNAEIQQGFEKYFKVRNWFLDIHLAGMSLRDTQYKFDVLDFDDWLIKEHGYDIEIHGSAADFVTVTFGDEACAFIKKLLEM